jgi:hypothetical protein
MRYMTIYKPADIKSLEAGVPPTEDEMMRMGQFIEELTKEGVLLHADGLLPSSTGARLQLSNGQFAVVDGPFTEAKELVGGFAILRVKSKSEAIEITKRFLKIAGDGECEIRQMYDEAASGTT